MDHLNPTDEADSLGALLRRPYRLLQERVYRDLADSGFPEIRPAHSVVFRHILPEGSRLTVLAELAGITKQSMGALVEHLAQHGYVTVGPDPEDGRAKRVHLSERGRQFTDAALQASQQVEQLLTRELGSRTMREMRRILGEMASVLSAEAIIFEKSEPNRLRHRAFPSL